MESCRDVPPEVAADLDVSEAFGAHVQQPIGPAAKGFETAQEPMTSPPCSCPLARALSLSPPGRKRSPGKKDLVASDQVAD